MTTDILSQIRSCLDAAGDHPGLAKAGVYQTEGYLRGLQGLPWEISATARPSSEDAAACFLYDVRGGSVALRGRLKKHSHECLDAFRKGMTKTFPESDGKQFAGALVRLWVRWLAALVTIPSAKDALSFSHETGQKVGEKLKQEYEEGLAGNLSAFLLHKRLHLGSIRPFLRMRGWLQGTIEFLSRDPDPSKRELSEILSANFSSIVLRTLHNAGPDYASKAVERLPSMMSGLNTAIRNLASTEPEAALFLRNNRLTILTRALHSGSLDYASQVSEKLPSAIKDLNSQIDRLETSSPETARVLRSNRRSVVYRALTNGRLDYLSDGKDRSPKALRILPPGSVLRPKS